MKEAKSKKPSAAPVVSAPNVIPMADIMLVLLIIFMVVTPMLQKGMNVDMAKVANPADMPNADKDDAVIVAVTRDGAVYLGQNKTDLASVASQVSDLIAGRLDKTVFIKSDARAKYGDVVKLVDEVRAAGVDNVGLLTDKVESATPPPPPPAD
jgi:biopolymer transport protein ExbD/biopolymer transport protein TolR